MELQTKAEPNVEQAVPFLWVSDIEASARYYVEGLGFEMTRQWTHEGKLRWCWLQLGGAALMLQESWKEGPQARGPDAKVGEGVAIYFVCKDALAIYRDLRSRGVQIPKRPFVGNGMWVTSLSDPDGYRLCFESPTDVAEETVLAEPAP